jgi:hypothetical protein
MVAVVDFRGTTPRTQGGVHGLRQYLFQLMGEPFLYARVSYGDELTFHFGREVELPPFRGRRRARGSHVLTTRASVWMLKSVPWASLIASDNWPAGVGSPIAPHDLENRPPITPGQRIVWIGAREFFGEGWPGGIELGLQFSDGSFLEVRPRYDPADPVYDLADWELFTPYNRYIKAGPGVVWEYAESDRPAAG